MGPTAVYTWLTVQGLTRTQWDKNRPWFMGGKQAMWFAPWRLQGFAPIWLRYDPKTQHFDMPWLHPGTCDLLFSAPLWLDSWSALENHWLDLAPTPQPTWEAAIGQAQRLLEALNPMVAARLVAEGLHTQGWEESVFVFWAQNSERKDIQALELRSQALLEAKIVFEEKFLKHRWSSWFIKKNQYQEFIDAYLSPGEWTPGADLKEQIVTALRQTQEQVQAPEERVITATYRPPVFHTLFAASESEEEERENEQVSLLLPKVPTNAWGDDFRTKTVTILPWQGNLTPHIGGYSAVAELEAVRVYLETVKKTAVVTLTPGQAMAYRQALPQVQDKIFSLQQVLVEDLKLHIFEAVVFCSLLTEHVSLSISRLYDEYAFIWPFVLNLNTNLVLALDPACLDVRLHHATGKVAQWIAENPSLLNNSAEELA